MWTSFRFNQWWMIAAVIGSAGVLALGAVPIASPLLDARDFLPRWSSGQWTVLHGWIHISSDLAIWSANTALAVLIISCPSRRRDVPFPKIVWLFAALFLTCGTVHLVDSVLFWWPMYRLSTALNAMNAIVSWVAVIVLVSTLNKLLAFPSKAIDIQLIMEHAPTAMLVADFHGRIMMVNQQTEVLFGFERTELIGEQLERLVPAAIRSYHPTLVQSYFDRPTVTQLGDGRELFGCHKNGHEIPVEIGLTPLKLDGKLVVLACLVNQTKQKLRREKELSELSQVLSLGEVVGGLAHELNTPIQRIVTWAAVLQLENPPGEYRESIEGMTLAAAEVGEIVQRLRDAVIRRETVDQPLNLNSLIRDTVTFMHREVTGLRTVLDETLPLITGDPIQLQLVLSNIIRNAYQSGGPVTITTQKRDGHVICTIDDCGPGFQVEPKRLFDPFYTTKANGLGMGLTITQSILRRYQGRITASNTGGGARFEFTLPAI